MNRNIRISALLLSLLMGITLQAHAKNAMHIVINNHLGAPEMLIDENQQVVWQAEYDEFGQATILVENVEFNHRLPGQYYDKETGLSYNYYRDYDPSLGRYVQSDPIGLAGGINTYGYVGGNPLNRTDRYGLIAGVDDAVVGSSILLGTGVACVAGYCDEAIQACAAVGQKLSDMMNGTSLTPIIVAAIISEAVEGDDAGANEGTNPYEGPVSEPVIVVDENGNAIPVEEGQQVKSSPNGDYQQVLGSDGQPTGTRMDRGGHKGQSDSSAQAPHGHVPGVTQPNGNPHLPIY